MYFFENIFQIQFDGSLSLGVSIGHKQSLAQLMAWCCKTEGH